MKKIFIVFALYAFCSARTSQNTAPYIDTMYDLKIKKIIKAYKEKNCNVFLTEFPSDFSGMVSLYGYDEYNPDRNIYKYYQEHIGFLFNCNKNANGAYFVNKIVSLSIDGKWESDAVSMFQNSERELLLRRMDVFLLVLKKKSVYQQRHFWHFIFDGSPPHDKQIKQLYNSVYNLLAKKAPDQAKIVKQEFYRMYH